MSEHACEIVSIDSASDPCLERYLEEYRRKRNRQDGYFIAESQFLVQRLLESSFEVESLVVDDLDKIPKIPQKRRGEFPIYVISREQIRNLTGFNFHRGILASGKRTITTGIQELFPSGFPPQSTLLAASKIGDFENLGAIIRTACAFGADAVLLDAECADPFSRRSLRVSVGHAFKIPICESKQFLADLQLLQEQHFQAFATVLSPTATHLRDVKPGSRSVVVVGNEGYGLTPEVINACDHQITIPMQRGSDSLNVAMASGIFLYHFQEHPSGRPSRPV